MINPPKNIENNFSIQQIEPSEKKCKNLKEMFSVMTKDQRKMFLQTSSELISMSIKKQLENSKKAKKRMREHM